MALQQLKDLKTLDIAYILLLLDFGIFFAFGILYSVLGTFMPYHEDFIGITASDVKAYNPDLMTLISGFIRLLGFSTLALGISGLFILRYAFREGERWAWLNFAIYIPVLLIPLLIITYAITGLLGLPFIVIALGTIFWIGALAISFRDFF